MRTGRRLFLMGLSLVLGACNMVTSETPVFTQSDRTSLLPRDGIWLSDDPECEFDASRPESTWPQCALWLVVRDSGTEMHMKDGKRQSERIGGLFAAGTPAIVQGEWFDEAKEPRKTFYAFYGLEPRDVGADGRFVSATVWVVECGTQEKPNGDIMPFPGITPECRPTSKDAIRSAAAASQRPDEYKQWRWLREDVP